MQQRWKRVSAEKSCGRSVKESSPKSLSIAAKALPVASMRVRRLAHSRLQGSGHNRKRIQGGLGT